MTPPTAILLAAGRGSRLGSLTADTPKCLLQLGGRTLLDWQLTSLKHAGIEQVVLVGGYRGELLRKRIEEYHKTQEHAAEIERPPAYRENVHWERSNMVRSLLCAEDLLRETDCILCYGDILFHPGHVGALYSTPADIAITYDRHWRALWEARFEQPLQDAETFVSKSGHLLEIGGRAERLEHIRGQYMGLTLIRPPAWARIEGELSRMSPQEIDRLDMTALFRRLLSTGAEIRAVPVEGRWCEVDSPADIDLYRSKLATIEWDHDWRWGGKT